MDPVRTLDTVVKFAPHPVPSIAIAVIVVVIALAPAHAQESSDTTKSKATESRTEAAPTAIPLSQLTNRAEDAASELRAMRDRPVQDTEIQHIDRALPGAIEELQRLTELTDAALARSVSARTVDDLIRRWERARKYIDGWRTHVTRRSQAIDRDLQSLEELRRLWQATRESAVKSGGDRAVLNLVDTTLDRIEREEARFREHRARMLSISIRVGQAEEMIDNAFDQLDTAQKELQARLFRFDAPPLWTALAHPPPKSDYLTQIRSVVADAASELKSFFIVYRVWLIVHGLALILLWLLIRSLRNRVKQLQLDDPNLEDAINVVSHPFAAALLLALAALLLFYPYAPRVVHELTTILCFVPLYLILPRRLFKRLGTLLIWLICLHITDRFADILPDLSLLRRLLLLLLSVVTFAVLIRVIRDDSSAGVRGARMIRAVEKTAALLVVVAFISNVLGGLSLTDAIVTAVISSAYGALVLYAIYLIIDAVLRIGMDTRIARMLRMVRRHADLIRRRITTVLQLGLGVLWAVLALHLLQILPAVIDILRSVLAAKAHFGDISLSLGSVLAFVVTVWAAFVISRVMRFFLEEDIYPRLTLPRGIPNAISTGLHYALLLFAFILAVAATGADLGKFTILAGAFGVGIGFGLQNIVNNFISGLILIVERPIMPGDTVQFGDKVGNVKRIGLRSSTIRTWSGAEVIVPNGNLISSDVINWTLSDKQRRLDIPVGVSYGSPVKQVMEILESVASRHEEILETPEPRTLFMGFGSSSLDFELRCWTNHFDRYLAISSDLVVGIEAALNEAGIVIPFPQRDLHVKTVGDKAGRALRGEAPGAEEPAKEAGSGELPRVPKTPPGQRTSDGTTASPGQTQGGDDSEVDP
jgi:potassium efflux system protein